MLYGMTGGMKLSEYLSITGMRPSHLAAKIGSPNTTISRLIHGERKPSWGLMRRISQATNGYVKSIDDFDLHPADEGTDRPRE